MQDNIEKNRRRQSKKRFYAACAAMQGLICHPLYLNHTDKKIVEDAYNLADELLKQENE